MDSKTESGTGISDHRLVHLIAWEARLLGSGRNLNLRIVLVAVGIAVVLPCIWRFSIEPEPFSQNAGELHGMAQMYMWIMPLHSARDTLDEMSFCTVLLRLAGCVAILLTMLLLPGIAAAGVARDRQTGRLDELVATTYSSLAIYSAKAIAAVLPFWLPCVCVYIVMLPVAASEYLTIWSVLQPLVDVSGQLALISIISVTASCICRHSSTARAAAYLITWGVMPALWALTITVANADGRIHEVNDFPMSGPSTKWTLNWTQLYWLHLAYIGVLCLLFAFIGVRRLFPRHRSLGKGQRFVS